MRPAKTNWFRHIGLFVLTAVSTTATFNRFFGAQAWFPPTLSAWIPGMEYAFWLLVILGCHEAGHYFAAKRHRVPATLPFFIPFPLPPLGTMGAVIGMSPYIPNRRALFDIAVAGPLAGLAAAIPVCYWSMLSTTRQLIPDRPGTNWQFADPLLLRIIEFFTLGPRPEGYDVVLTPMGYAAWVGMLVTASNLIPISQLDGGHVSHALLGRNSRWLSFAVFAVLIVVTVANGWQYILLILMVWYIGLVHSPTLDDAIPLGRTRTWIGVGMVFVFLLCVTLQPFVSTPGQPGP